MTLEFDADWLRLREPLDEAARAVGLAWAFGRLLPAQPMIIDLGAGTGSNVRQLAMKLGRPVQDWTLIEKDRKLLSKAPGEIGRWADRNGWEHKEQRRAYMITCDDMAVRVEMRSFDLAQDPSDLGLDQYDGVTAKALFDLVSLTWLERFVKELTNCGYPPVLVTLTVDGRVDFSMSDPDDGWVLDLFHAHMNRAKGLGGPALGTVAPQALITALTGAGYKVETAQSDWKIGPKQIAAHLAMISGYERAAIEQDPVSAPRIQAWAERRRLLASEKGARLTVGHQDLLARR
ncbi:hypothetical protein CHU95_06750 [Niveispirillum lacus]|uniref:Class I SAM-dependent methyltransferase n=1 Tax=Niveispirillum lacus TaxID=1981099 RepID=A0A255Z393_9PROT|nr:hypothetical protein [Niveispirillum lacus]OYQ35947.1 hypothetical protein CHU95_06750 [Niveispirillum lacus]